MDRCSAARGGEFAFGSVLCAFMFERMVVLHSQIVLDPPAMQDPKLMIWGKLLPRQVGGKVGNYFTPLF